MIHILTPDVYNRIAAGEVVDRPYSVVKELVENAVDAGASEITIEIEGGGKKRIRVTDNGCGIPQSDLKKAFLPHATSKLQTAEDLEAISTLGFRGEAVCSISSVSRMKILSRSDGNEAFSLVNEGGKLGEILPAGGAKGTCVTVDDLFFNTPARLKFLKSDSQEEADVTAMVGRFLLSRPEISFTYLVNGKVRFRSFGDGLKSALALLYGTSILDQCIEIEAEKHGIRLRGFLGNQNFSKPNRSYQNLFVNGRYVVNQTVSSAVANSYASYLMKRQYPFYVLFLDVPPQIVDVNVHPNKIDVRFADNQVIYGTVYSIVSAVLDGSSRALEYTVSQEFKAKPTESASLSNTKEESVSKHVPSKRSDEMTFDQAKEELKLTVPQVKRMETEDELNDSQVKRTKTEDELNDLQVKRTETEHELTDSRVKRTETEDELTDSRVKRTEAELELTDLRVKREEKELEFIVPPINVVHPVYNCESPLNLEVHAPERVRKGGKKDYFEDNKKYLAGLPKQEKIDPQTLIYKGELFRTYLLYESGDEVFLIDQHAAHERILFQKLKARIDAKTSLSQPALLPEILHPNAQEFAFLKAQIPILESFGFEIEEFGGGSFKISAIPADLFDMNLSEFFKEVLSSMETLRAIKLSDLLRDKLATMACKAAVKGGTSLTDEEVRALIEDLNGNMGVKCPHGRPACVKIKRTELEKLFKRVI